MTPTVAVFQSRADAQRGIDALLKSGLSIEKINFLTPNTSRDESAHLQVSDSEQPGMGAAVGSLAGGAVGTAGGFAAGAALASLLIPGVGPNLVGGLLGASLLGLGGATGGAAAGEAIEERIPGIPHDELFVYEDALRQGRTVVIAEAEDEAHAKEVQDILVETGAETIDAAREKWWIGLRDAEMESYSGDRQEEGESSTEAALGQLNRWPCEARLLRKRRTTSHADTERPQATRRSAAVLSAGRSTTEACTKNLPTPGDNLGAFSFRSWD